MKCSRSPEPDHQSASIFVVTAGFRDFLRIVRRKSRKGKAHDVHEREEARMIRKRFAGDETAAWPLTPQSFRPIASSATPASPINAARGVAQVRPGQLFFLMLVVRDCDPAPPEPRRAVSARPRSPR